MQNNTERPQNRPVPKSRRPSLFTVAIVLLMLAGLGVLLYPTLSDRFARWQAMQEIIQYNQVAEAEQADYSDLWAAAEEYNRRLAETGTFTGSVLDSAAVEDLQEVSQYLNPMGTGMMGYIDIPKISVHLPIYQGTEETELQSGAGFWIGTSLPTGGPSTHCVITAHNGLVKAKMFTDLDQLVEGDTFILTILDRVLTYEVDQILVALPNGWASAIVPEQTCPAVHLHPLRRRPPAAGARPPHDTPATLACGRRDAAYCLAPAGAPR